MTFRSITYVSSAARLFLPEELVALLRVSQRNNLRDGITGMLLYKNGNFMQVIEGETATVDQLHARIEKDHRHHGVLTLLDRTLLQREFPEWSMGFRNLSDADLSATPGFNEFLNEPLTSETLADPSRALKLLCVFRQQR